MSVECEVVEPRWSGLCIVAATGPSLTPEIADACRGHRIVAVNDAYRLLPFADVLYACDRKWIEHHEGCSEFRGEKWSSHQPRCNEKLDVAGKYGWRLVQGQTAHGFSIDPAVIHYGRNSGFQAINLAILFGAIRIVLVGFDMRTVNGSTHFFGDHPDEIKNGPMYGSFIPHFERAAKQMPAGIEILNCTPGSALKCFPEAHLGDALGA